MRNDNGRGRTTMVVVRLGIEQTFAQQFQEAGLAAVQDGDKQARIAKCGAPVIQEPGSWSLLEILAHLSDNLSMVLAHLYLVEKPAKEKGDKPRYFLILKFCPDQETKLPSEFRPLVVQAFSRRYGELACFQNPNGTFVVNATAPMSCDGRPMKLMILPNRRLAVYNETTHRPHTLDRVVL